MKKITTFAELAQIKAGEEFVMRGLTYRAKDDAIAGVNEKTKVAGVVITADRENPSMPSGWEAADVVEYDSMWPAPATPASTFALTGDTVLRVMDRATGQHALKTLDGFLSDCDINALTEASLRKALSAEGSQWGYAFYVVWYDEDPACAYEVCVEQFYQQATGEEG